MKNIILALVVLAFASKISYPQDKIQIKLACDKKHSNITYAMNHPLHAWTGECTDVTSVILADEAMGIISQVAVVVKVASFDSKNANRDSHMMEVTEALKFPTISFSSTSIIQEGENLKVIGTLVFHGVSHTIGFDVQKKKVKNSIELSGGFSVKMTDYNIDPPSLMAMSTDDEIKIAFKMVY